jgi:hypothetical protein
VPDDLDPGTGGGLLPPPGERAGDEWWDALGARASARPGGLVLEFPVEVEIRLVSPERPDLLADTTIHRLTAALEGLA